MSLSPEYPSPHTKEVVLIVGPSGIGKSAIIAHILALDPDIGHPTPFTTRLPRPDDKPGLYNYITIEELEKMPASEIAQQITHPDGSVYGTLLSSYTQPLSILDVMTEGVADFRNTAFTKVSILGIIASADKWMHRLNLRYPINHPLRQHRLGEALRCFEWISANNPPLIINDAPTNEPAAREVLSYLRHDNNSIDQDQTAARRILADNIIRAQRELDAL